MTPRQDILPITLRSASRLRKNGFHLPTGQLLRLEWKSSPTAAWLPAHSSDKDAAGTGSSMHVAAWSMNKSKSEHNPHHLHRRPLHPIHSLSMVCRRIPTFSPHIAENGFVHPNPRPFCSHAKMPCSSCLTEGHNCRTCPNLVRPLRRKVIRILLAPPPPPVWVCRHCKRESKVLFYAVQHERRCRNS
jgi:hypothetical protein